MFSELTEFDKRQINLLMPLVNGEVVLHFPFFVNTFSIAFHYSTAILKNKNRELVRDYIIEQNWDESIPSDFKNGNDNIFYATLDAIEKEIDKNRSFVFYYRPISHYIQRYIFSDYHIFLRSENIEKFPGRKFLDTIKNPKLNRIEIFTDIPTQAELIRKTLTDYGFKNEIVIIAEPVDSIMYYKGSMKVLRLFYYGAPTTSRMLIDRFSYIPFELTQIERSKEDKTMITCICLSTKEYNTSSNKDDYLDILSEYHNNIFEQAAKEGRHIDFMNVLWAYNRFAERKQHSAIFSNTTEFTRCLIDHHESYRVNS